MKKLVLVTLMATVLSGCATDDPNKRTKTGAAIGAAAGALLGYAVDDGTGGVVAGAAVGALAGAGVGMYMDKQQQEFEAALADEPS